ncbi:hypothetical protein QO179_24675 [Bacillus stercoris]|nr:hypothetical protein [Bacillus stercoris]
METLQVGIKSLFKSSASEPWKMTFVSPSDESEVTVELGKNGSVEVGPRLSEVLSSIEQYNTFPRTVTGEELDALGMATRDSFIIKQLAGRTVSAEIGFRPFRRFMNPSSPKVKGVYGEPKATETVVSSANEFKAQTVEIHGKTSGGKPTKASNPIQDGDIIEIKYRESGNNQIDFFDALDDRREEIWTDTNVDSKVRIGDVLLIIPPLAIDVNRTSSIQKVKTLRSKSSMMVKGGSSATTITLQLYFHDLESINGRKVKMHKEKDRNYYMDGLRPLIAQFKKAPFLPIDNKYINETLGIDSVALVNLAVQTVPGFPRSLSATLTLAKFDHQAYMPQVPRLGDVINYPMLRWYYQEPLRDDIPESERSPYRTYLKPIPSRGLNNSFKFQKAVEDELQQRKQAIQDLRNMDNPIVSQTKFETPDSDATDATTQLGREYKDGIAAQKVLEQYKRYKQLKDAGKITKERDSDGRVPVVYQITQGGNTNKEAHEIYKEIYGDAHDDVYVMGVSHYAPFESWIHAREANWDENSQGSIKLRLYSQNNIDLFSSSEVVLQGGNGDLTVVLFKGSDIAKLNKIIKRGNSARKSYEDKVAKYEDLKNLLDEGESTLTLEDYDIEGLLPMSMTVMYENQFSNIQLEGLEGPSFQFLGGQDPYVQVLFEATEEGVAGLRYLLEEVDRYSREYRTGITSGFMGVKNDLFQLFGISTVMVENVQIRTKPGFPGRFEVELALCGFNKTQKRSERLEGISPIYGDVVDRSTREAKNYDPSADEAIVEIGMRKLEVYPDLELPTYNELISALPYIGADCNVYENRTGGIYVDPDFYVATPTTMREIMRDESKTEQILKMKDFTGIEMATSSQSTNPLDGDADMWDLLKSVDSRSTKIDPTFSWSGSVKTSLVASLTRKVLPLKVKR